MTTLLKCMFVSKHENQVTVKRIYTENYDLPTGLPTITPRVIVRHLVLNIW